MENHEENGTSFSIPRDFPKMHFVSKNVEFFFFFFWSELCKYANAVYAIDYGVFTIHRLCLLKLIIIIIAITMIIIIIIMIIIIDYN